jgi:hypothetical protein
MVFTALPRRKPKDTFLKKEMEPYIDEDSAAQIIGIKPAQLTALARQKKITHIKVARGVRVYLESDLHDYMQHARRLASWSTDAKTETAGGFDSTTRRRRENASNAMADPPRPQRKPLNVH